LWWALLGGPSSWLSAVGGKCGFGAHRSGCGRRRENRKGLVTCAADCGRGLEFSWCGCHPEVTEALDDAGLCGQEAAACLLSHERDGDRVVLWGSPDRYAPRLRVPRAGVGLWRELPGTEELGGLTQGRQDAEQLASCVSKLEGRFSERGDRESAPEHLGVLGEAQP
jgi:hypothetical protein